VIAGLLLLMLPVVIARADGYPAAVVPTDPIPVVSVDFDPAVLPKKPGCTVVKAGLKIGDKTLSFDFILYLPPGFPNTVGFENGPVPVLVSLHNRAAIGGDARRALGESLPNLLAERDADDRFEGEKPQRPVPLHNVAPLICIAPHCPDGYAWESPGMAQAVGLLIDAVVAGLHADPDRVCLTGFSYGASSTWVVAQQIPERFAAISVNDGRRTDNAAVTAAKLKHVAIYLTAGDNDGDFTNDARTMVAGLAAGMHPNFVYREWHGGNHFVYGSTYTDPIFWTWLQGQKRAPLEVRQPPQPTAPPAPVQVAAAPVAPPAVAPVPPPRLAIDPRSWPDKPGYFLMHGMATIGGQSQPFATAIYLPPIFATHPENLPVVVSLHNRGDGGAQGRAGLATVLHPTTAPVEAGVPGNANFIGILPHLPATVDWTNTGASEALGDLIEQTATHYKANPKRVSLTGCGNGAAAIWSIATALPGRFAAIAILDAKIPADTKNIAAGLQNTGIYLACNSSDPSLVADAERLHDSLTTLPHRDFCWQLVTPNNHTGAEALYRDPHVWDWLLDHHLK
jgi:predicted peptidase